MIFRPEYVEAVKPFMDQPLVKILAGVRRSGKSTIFEMIREELLRRGVREDRILMKKYTEMDIPENITANLVFVNDRLVAADINQTIENGFTVPLLSGNVADLTDKFGCSETTSCETETDVIETTASETAAVTETSSAVTEVPPAAETTAVTPHSSMR